MSIRIIKDKEYWPMTYGSRIKQIRKSLGLTQAQFGNAIGVSNGHISNIERDQDVLSNKALKAMCDAFDINEKWFLSGEGTMSGPISMIEKSIPNSNEDIRMRLTRLELHESEAAALKNIFYSYTRIFDLIKLLQSDDAQDFVVELNLLIKEWEQSTLKERIKIEVKLEDIIPDFTTKKANLLSGEKDVGSYQKGYGRVSKFMIPVMGRSAAGLPMEMIEAPEDSVYVDGETRIQPGDFAVIAVGDSMVDAGISDGSKCIIRPQSHVENGQIALVAVGDGSTIKRFFMDDNGFRLVPCNSAYKVQHYTTKDSIRVLGRLISVVR